MAFDDDFAAAEDLLDEVFGAAVVVSDGEFSVSITATCQDLETSERGKDGRDTLQRYRVYVFKTEDLVLNGRTIYPRAGLQFTETIDGVPRTFEVVRRSGNNRPAAERLMGGDRWQVFTQQVSDE